MAKRKKRKRYQEVEYYSLSPETKKGIIIIFLFIIAIISILSFLGIAGTAGTYIDWGLGIVFGWGRFIFPLILIGLGYVLARPSHYEVTIPNYIGVVLFLFSLHGLLHLKLPFDKSFDLTFSGLGGGIIGYVVSYPILLYLGFIATLIILFGVLFASVLLMFNTSIEKVFETTTLVKTLPIFKSNNTENSDENDEDDEEDDDEEEYEDDEEEYEDDDEDTQVHDTKITARTLTSEKDHHPSIRTPKIKVDLPIKLLDDKKSKPTSGDIKLGQERIHNTLENFNIPVEMDAVQVGPTVTQYTLKPADGIKLSKITTLSNDLALALAAHPIRIEAPIPGKSLVGIEVPNQKPAIVRIREIIESANFKTSKSNLSIVLGKDVSGKCWVDDINSMPHLLVAGATGSGKSVCLNAILMSLLYRNNPDTLRLILVDPKRVEFPVYNGIPHLLTPVITDVTKTVYSLRWAITEMDRRFDILAKAKKRDIKSYNLTTKNKMPHIVIIIDELADLMVAAAAEVEGAIIRLTQMARAVGIHLVVATQRPSVDVITGLIKANIPCRIAFSVASLMDSRTILDSSGAEKLVGKGDMLFMTPRTSKPRRLQGAFVSDEEIKRVVDFLKNACDNEPDYQEEVTEKPKSNSSFDFKGGADDDLFEEAKELVIQADKASASYLQRRLRVGYARAARLIDLLEEAGIVGPADGAKPRDILVDKNTAYSQPVSQAIEPADTEEEYEDDDDETEDDTVEEDSNDEEMEELEESDDDDQELEEANPFNDDDEEQTTSNRKNSTDNEIY
jgi:DNA segregation ATPase FtsK/SpoIIIE, S-DNA-T family